MRQAIVIKNQKVYIPIDGVLTETADAKLIGETIVRLAQETDNSHLKGYKTQLDIYLKNNNKTRTPERYNILNEIVELKEAFTLKELHCIMRDKYRVSLTTLYNVKEIFLKCGILQRENDFIDVKHSRTSKYIISHLKII